jgi:hypothetical protein
MGCKILQLSRMLKEEELACMPYLREKKIPVPFRERSKNRPFTFSFYELIFKNIIVQSLEEFCIN